MRLQGAGFHIRRQTCGGGPQASLCRNQSALKVELKVELRLQPKIGRLAHQAAVDLSFAGRAKSSREQAPAYYTSARHQANRRETDVALH